MAAKVLCKLVSSQIPATKPAKDSKKKDSKKKTSEKNDNLKKYLDAC